MIYLKKFNESFEGGFPTDRDEIMKICEAFAITPSHIHPDGTCDFDGDVDLSWRPSGYRISRAYTDHSLDMMNTFFDGGERLPIKFGRVSGALRFDYLSLTTLEGSPEYVGKGFNCGGCPIVDLRGGPKEVKGRYSVKNCKNLTSLEGLPDVIYEPLILKGCQNLWDFRRLGDVSFQDHGSIDGDLYNFVGSSIIKKFAGDSPYLKLQKFYDSLIFNYIRPPVIKDGHKHFCVNLFRFTEALDDAEIDIETFRDYNFWGLGSWSFVNDGGEIVDFDGNLIDSPESVSPNPPPKYVKRSSPFNYNLNLR